MEERKKGGEEKGRRGKGEERKKTERTTRISKIKRRLRQRRRGRTKKEKGETQKEMVVGEKNIRKQSFYIVFAFVLFRKPPLHDV
jgi:hypothetical protein